MFAINRKQLPTITEKSLAALLYRTVSTTGQKYRYRTAYCDEKRKYSYDHFHDLILFGFFPITNIWRSIHNSATPGDAFAWSRQLDSNKYGRGTQT